MNGRPTSPKQIQRDEKDSRLACQKVEANDWKQEKNDWEPGRRQLYIKFEGKTRVFELGRK